MIRTGLVDQRLGGGFQKGYPTDRNPHPRNDIERPYVYQGDAAPLSKSAYSSPMDYKPFTPSEVVYNDLFGDKTSPDERLYILKQVQQGKVNRQSFIKVPRGLPEVLPPKPKMPVSQPANPAIPGPAVPTTGEGVQLEQEEEAVDVVEPPQIPQTNAEIAASTNRWIHDDSYGHGLLRDVTAGTLGFIAGDVPAAAGAIGTARFIDSFFHTSRQVENTITGNGTGPRHRDIAPAA
jgi:hypothetical protein